MAGAVKPNFLPRVVKLSPLTTTYSRAAVDSGCGEAEVGEVGMGAGGAVVTSWRLVGLEAGLVG